MKNYIYKGISLTLATTMAVWCLSGCGTVKDTETSGKATNSQEKTDDAKENQADIEALLTSNLVSKGC